MSISGHVENGTPWNQREEREREKDTYYVLLSPSHSLSFFLVLFCILFWWSFHWLLSVGVQQLCFTLFSLEWAPRYNSTAVMYSSLFCVCRYLYILLTGARGGPAWEKAWALPSVSLTHLIYTVFCTNFFLFFSFPFCVSRGAGRAPGQRVIPALSHFPPQMLLQTATLIRERLRVLGSHTRPPRYTCFFFLSSFLSLFVVFCWKSFMTTSLVTFGRNV